MLILEDLFYVEKKSTGRVLNEASSESKEFHVIKYPRINFDYNP